MRRDVLGLAAVLLLLWNGVAPADAAVLKLLPADTRIAMTVYTMGVFAQEGRFSRFTGTLSFDPSQAANCHVALQVEVASLTMATDSNTRLALGPTMLDAAHFPMLSYEGDCMRATTEGRLTLHGSTHPLVLTTVHTAKGMTASGSLHRQDYGVHGFPGLVGGTIHIVFSVDLPAELAGKLPR